MSEKDDGNNMRLVFRPTTNQYTRLQKIYNQGRFKHLSELIRHILNLGLDKFEEE